LNEAKNGAGQKKKCGQMATLTWLYIASYLLLDAKLLGYVGVWKTTVETSNYK